MSARKFTPEQEAEVARRYLAGESTIAIGLNILDVPLNHVTVKNTLKRLGIPRRPSAAAASQEAKALRPPIPEETKQRIIEMCQGGTHIDAVAATIGVGRFFINQTLREYEISLPTGRPRSCSINDHAFDVLTPEAKYWIGFICADGCLHQDDWGSPALVVGLSAIDREHLEKLRAFLGSTHKISEFPPHDSKPIIKGDPPIKTGPTVYFRVRSKQIFKTLTERGIVTKAARIPPTELAKSRDFWRGAIDGDGSLGLYNLRGYTYPKITLVGQLPLLERFQQFLIDQRLAKLVPYRDFRKESLWQIATMGSTVRDIIKFLYKDATIALTRKQAIAHTVFDWQNICEK